MVATENWVFLVYQLPREPSTPRISVWRKLKRLGVAQVASGVVALPYDAVTKEQLEWIAQEVSETGGEASIWIATPTARQFGRELARTLARDRATEYTELARKAESLFDEPPSRRKRGWERLQAEMRRIERRDHHRPPERVQARRALLELDASTKNEHTP